MPNTPITPDTADSDSAIIVDTPSGTIVCNYEFSDDHLLALWFELQREEVATCPITGAEIDLDLENPAEGTGAPVVKVKCTLCGRTADFEPGPHEGFGWAE